MATEPGAGRKEPVPFTSTEAQRSGDAIRPGPQHARPERWGLVLICLGGFALRVSPFFRFDGTLGWPVDYDEGVYTTAALLLRQGVWPYRDYFFAHPPGVLLFLAPLVGWAGPAMSLVTGRWAVAVLSTVTMYLLGRTVERQAGWPAALFAVSVYAVWPEAVIAERQVVLEPLLNLLGMGCLVSVSSQGSRSLVRAGVLLGLMLSVKWWAGAWLVAALVISAPRQRRSLIISTLLTFALITLPFALRAPTAFIEQTLLFHLHRPPDGDRSLVVRLNEMFFTHLPRGPIIIAAMVLGFRERLGRFSLIASGLLVTAFLAAAAFWNSYDAHLALPLSLGAGIGLGRLTKNPLITVGLALVCLVPGVDAVLELRHLRDPAQQARAKLVTRSKPCAFDVADLLLANTLPANRLIDSYGAMLNAAGRSESLDAAFASPAAQTLARESLTGCEQVIFGPRGERQVK